MTRIAFLAVIWFGALAARAAAAQQRNPTAHCNDGTYFYGASRRAACAHHRGVSEWLARPRPVTRPRHPSAARRAPKAGHSVAPHRTTTLHHSKPRPARASARCRDGSWSTDPRRASACTGHRGIARWLGRH